MENLESIEIVTDLSPDEWKAVRDLRIRAVKDAPAAFGQTEGEAGNDTEATWRDRFSKSVYVFARENGTLMGMASATPETNEKTKHLAYIRAVYLDPKLRGLGVGRRIMEALMKEVCRRFPAVFKFSLHVTTSQEAAKHLYESLGFKKSGLLEKEMCIDGVFVDEWSMEKFLR